MELYKPLALGGERALRVSHNGRALFEADKLGETVTLLIDAPKAVNNGGVG